MSEIGRREIKTQQHVIEFFTDELDYEYLGNWKDRDGNSNLEKSQLTGWLKTQGHDERIIDKVLRDLDKARTISGSKTLYDANREVYSLLRYGVKVRPDVGEQHTTVWLIDWENPGANNFAVAEEVTITSVHNKRPDLVLYVNGIALGVLELKRSTISVTEGIRQNLDNQKKDFIRHFFSTIQLVMAGNDTEGLRYGVIETPEKYWLEWKEESQIENPLDRALQQLCRKERLLEIVHDFIVFDAGIKKICRHNQYLGMRAAQEHVKRREGGILWHTQGSGKTLLMVWFAKWIREHVENSRVLIITDRTELDEQIEEDFLGVDENIYRARSGSDLIEVLNQNTEWLVCSLIHKFGRSEEGDIDAYLKDIENHLPFGFHAKGEIFVFVDECHRTQSGKLHKAMKTILPEAMLIGFTGTPLLKKDKQKSIEVFGPYIHTYKYDEAVEDGVVLDLHYEARDIDQNITSPERVEEWFKAKTTGLSDLALAQLKQRWGTMQKMMSSRGRLEKIVADIMMDMETRDRLKNGHGNALLVCDRVYTACRLFEMFQETSLQGQCAIITSYRPSPSDIKGEETGEGLTEILCKYETYRKMLADHFDESEESAMTKTDDFEKEVKKRFVNDPGQMKLLIVVDKLLTGFDAPPATYLYIDKQMHDHGLFQAICRVNRRDSDDKEYGYIIDYKDLFRSLEQSYNDYTGEAFEGYDVEDVAGLLKDRLEKAREILEVRREEIKELCEPVEPPRDQEAHLRYFCGISNVRSSLKDNEPRRVLLYKLTASLMRAYANIANEMEESGYSESEISEIKNEVIHFEKLREEVKLRSGDYVDTKVYEPAMRHLLDTYIRAEESETISAFDDMSLVELIVERGEKAIESLPKGISGSEEAVAETIENNVRKVIIDEMAVNPRYYEKMSDLLDDLIKTRRQQAIDYKEYLAKIIELTKNVHNPETHSAYPVSLNSAPRRALYDNLVDYVAGKEVPEGESPDNGHPPDVEIEQLAIAVDEAILSVKKDDWRGMRTKRIEVRNAIKSVLGDDQELLDTIFEIVKSQRDY